MTQTAIGYTRLSQKSDTSLGNQKQNIREYCDEHGLKLDRIYDDGQQASGWDGSRDEYSELKQRLRDDDDLDVVVLHDKRRIARDVDEVMRLIPDFREYNVELHTVLDGQLDLADPMHAAIEILQAAAAHQEKLKEIEKGLEVTEARQDNEYWMGEAPYGLKFGVTEEYGKRLVPDPGEWCDVERVLALRNDGISYREIEEKTDVAYATAYRIIQRREVYEQARARADRHGLSISEGIDIDGETADEAGM
ncbi:recombinase family protein [Halopenitus persicus]|uniref:Site-specific DNA recombinase n=1 Tax=Halopenitus persicus TaxID=1048396 RepID=A0A1H3NSV7_9EURY|nr:recombinase family protein [Halopenitus persicus]SDY91833.1 Site-specific DNA recombinase [Halopenitus persicus]